MSQRCLSLIPHLCLNVTMFLSCSLFCASLSVNQPPSLSLSRLISVFLSAKVVWQECLLPYIAQLSFCALITQTQACSQQKASTLDLCFLEHSLIFSSLDPLLNFTFPLHLPPNVSLSHFSPHFSWQIQSKMRRNASVTACALHKVFKVL